MTQRLKFIFFTSTMCIDAPSESLWPQLWQHTFGAFLFPILQHSSNFIMVIALKNLGHNKYNNIPISSHIKLCKGNIPTTMTLKLCVLKSLWAQKETCKWHVLAWFGIRYLCYQKKLKSSEPKNMETFFKPLFQIFLFWYATMWCMPHCHLHNAV